MSLPENEKRRSSRLPVNLKYRLTLDDDNEITHTGIIRNISLSGAYLAQITPDLTSTDVFQKGMVSINTENEWVTMKCEIVYIGTGSDDFPKGVGVAFCQDDEYTATAIWNMAIQCIL